MVKVDFLMDMLRTMVNVWYAIKRLKDITPLECHLDQFKALPVDECMRCGLSGCE